MKDIIRAPKTYPLAWCLRDGRQSVWLDEYRSRSGYEGAHKALTGLPPNETVNQVRDADPKRRGGVSFSIGLKWSLMPKGKSMNIRYLLCSTDKIEPGTYKDRLLMGQLSHLLMEGMLISVSTPKTYRGYVSLHGEYIETVAHLCRTIAEVTEAGLLGKNIMGTGFDFELFVHTGAGRYICGEETTLINSLEDRHANPRSKPPFPANSGAWDKPTCVSSVETLCNALAIPVNGVEWYQNISKSKDTGIKLMGFSGHVESPDLWGLPLGTTMREILEDYTGGIRDGLKFEVWQFDDAGTGFLTKAHLNLPMEFESIDKVGNRLGTVLAMAVDHEIGMASLVCNPEGFFARESCGWCTPCRDDLSWSVKTLRAPEHGEDWSGDIETLEQLCRFPSPGKAFCTHAPDTVEPLQSIIKYFRKEFEAGIKQFFSNTHQTGGVQSNLLKERW